MNKMKQLIRQLVTTAIITLVVVGLAAGAMVFTGGFADSAAEKKSKADSQLSADTTQLNSVRQQLDRSGEAEKRFVDIQLNRTSTDYSNNIDKLKDWMRDAKGRYRFANNFKLNLPPEKAAEKPELAGLDYSINVRNDIVIELEAISDLHVFSFIEDLQKSAPGVARITELSVERRGDLQPQTYLQMTGGMAPYLVTAKLKFNWVGVNPKEKPEDATAKSAGAPASGEPAHAAPAAAGGM